MGKTEKINLYNENIEVNCRKVRKTMLFLYFIYLAVMLAANILIFIFLRQKNLNLTRFIVIVLTAVLFVSTFFFFSTKFRLTHKYCRMLKFFRTGLIEETRVKFLNYDETLTDKEGVEFYSMIVHEKVKKRPDMPERHILIDKTVVRPDLKEDDVLLVYTHANILVSYSVLNEEF